MSILAGAHWRMCGGNPRLHTQPRSLWRTSMAKHRGPWEEQIGGGPAVWIARSFGVTVLLHLRQTHSGCHSRVTPCGGLGVLATMHLVRGGLG